MGKPLADGGNQEVKVKVRINLHGIFVVSSANYVEKHEVEEEVQMEVDPPKDEGGDKKESANAEAAPAPNPEEPPKADQDAEMKDAEGSKAAEDAPKKEYRTEKRKKVVSKTIDL